MDRVTFEIGDREYEVEVSSFEYGHPAEGEPGEVALGPRAWDSEDVARHGYSLALITYEYVLAEKVAAAGVDRLTADRMLHDEAYEQMCDQWTARAEEAENW